MLTTKREQTEDYELVVSINNNLRRSAIKVTLGLRGSARSRFDAYTLENIEQLERLLQKAREYFVED